MAPVKERAMPDELSHERVDELKKALRLSEQCLKAIANTLYEIGLEKSGKQAEAFALELSFIRLNVPHTRSH
jgi:hypothetical protein